MVHFKTKILKFDEMGEKTGWSYVEVPARIATQIKPDNKKSFRVKGSLDTLPVSGMALLPMGEGDFILVLKADIRKSLRKQKGDTLDVRLELDKKEITPPKELLDCLADEPEALKYFKSLPKSHQNYFGNWIRQAKQTPTKTSRIACVVDAMLKKYTYAEMLHAGKDKFPK